MIQDKKVLAFVPAKTGSVGLPGKLFKKIGDYSLLEWTLLAAYQSKCIDEIVVSSNDPLIKEATENFQKSHKDKVYTFIQRPDELCTPTSKTEDAMLHLFEAHPQYKEYDYLIMLQATSPARRNGLIDKCLDECINGKYDSLLTVKKMTPFFWRKNDMNYAYPTYSLKDRPMRQEIKEFVYFDNGNVYLTSVECFLKTRLRVSGATSLYETEDFELMQIDMQQDFDMMSALYDFYGNFL